MKRKILLLIPFLLLFGCQKKPPIDSSELTSTTDSTSETTSGSSEFVSENSDVVKLDFLGLMIFTELLLVKMKMKLDGLKSLLF